MMTRQATSTVTPRLRFREFRKTNVWTTTELIQLSAFVNERVGVTECTPYTVTSGVGLMSQQEKLGRTIAGNSLKNYVLLRRNDFAYNKSATKAFTQGFIARYMGDERAAVPNSIFTCFRVNEEAIDPTYLDNLFSSNLHGKWLKSRIAVGARAHGSLNVSDDDLMALPVPLPDGSKSLEEQKKIADCLTSLDEVIVAQGRKVEALKAHKRGLMQQLFPREGETRPRLRFPEFRNAGDWQRMPFGRAATFYNGRAYKQEELLESGRYPVLRVGNFFTSTTWYHSGLELDETKYCENGDLLYAWSASFGPRIWRGEKSIYHYHIWKVIEQPGVDKKFLFITLENETENMKAKTTNGLGIMHITKGAIESWESSFPTIAEQRKIAGFLTSLDNTITAEIEMVDTFKIHKVGLMQQLFPSTDAIQS